MRIIRALCATEDTTIIEAAGIFGRITAPLVFCGAICKKQMLAQRVSMEAHIQRIHDVTDAGEMTAQHLTKSAV